MARSAPRTERCVALVRGINVGRAKRVAMADLKAIVEGLGYTDVRTLLNSGNVVFSAPRSALRDAAKRIEAGLAALGVPAKTLVFAATELSRIVDENALTPVATDAARLLVAVFRTPEDREALEPILERDWSPEKFHLGVHAAYLWCPDGILASRLAESVNRILGERGTARNWTTIQKLYALVSTTS